MLGLVSHLLDHVSSVSSSADVSFLVDPMLVSVSAYLLVLFSVLVEDPVVVQEMTVTGTVV